MPTPSGGRRMPDQTNRITRRTRKTIISIVKEIAESMTELQSTKRWSKDVLWFDIPAFASRGVQPALKFFDKVFSNFESCKVDILETDMVVNGDMGLPAQCKK
jgi:hypothetical protein